MNYSFGIPLAPDFNVDYLERLMASIDYQFLGRPEYEFEIILCGGGKEVIGGPNVVHIPFDETKKPKWITRKKNLIIEAAKYPNLCILHDYYRLGAAWLDGTERYSSTHGDKWDVLCSKIVTFEGERHSDWLVDQSYMDQVLKAYPELALGLAETAPDEQNGPRWVCGLPYSETGLTHIQYVSGGYMFAKTEVFKDHPFDERYGWGEAAEDVLWSREVLGSGCKLKFNPYNTLYLQKPAKWRLYNMTDECLVKLKEMFPSE